MSSLISADYYEGMTTHTYTTTYNEQRGAYRKGALIQARVTPHTMTAYGVHTEWAVSLIVTSPTGDSSDFIDLPIPCLSLSQACDIADDYNSGLSPQLVGHFHTLYKESVSL